MATWRFILGVRTQDAIAAYYARYPDATAAEIEAWLRDRGFEAAPGDIEDCMAALDSHPNWRTGWINRNIHRYSGPFDPDQYLATRGYDEEDEWQIVDDLTPELDETEGEEYEDDEWEEGGEAEEDEHYGEVATAAAPALPQALGGEDRLPGIALAALALAVSAGVVIAIMTILR